MAVSVCRLELSQDALLGLTFTPGIIDTLQGLATLNAHPVHVGDPVSIPAFVIYSGRDSDGGSVDALPVGDGDGRPGVTMPLANVGPPTEIDVGLTTKIDLKSAALTDARTMTVGSMIVSIDGLVFDESPPVQSFTVVAGAKDIAVTKLDDDGSTSCALIASKP